MMQSDRVTLTGRTATRNVSPSTLVVLLVRSALTSIVSFRRSASAADEFQLPIYCSSVNHAVDNTIDQSLVDRLTDTVK